MSTSNLCIIIYLVTHVGQPLANSTELYSHFSHLYSCDPDTFAISCNLSVAVQEEVDVLILVMFGVHLLADIVVHRLQVGGVRAHLEGLIDFQMESLVQNGNPNEVEDGQLMGGPVMKRMIEADVTLVEGEKGTCSKTLR